MSQIGYNLYNLYFIAHLGINGYFDDVIYVMSAKINCNLQYLSIPCQ